MGLDRVPVWVKVVTLTDFRTHWQAAVSLLVKWLGYAPKNCLPFRAPCHSLLAPGPGSLHEQPEHSLSAFVSKSTCIAWLYSPHLHNLFREVTHGRLWGPLASYSIWGSFDIHSVWIISASQARPRQCVPGPRRRPIPGVPSTHSGCATSIS